jgi:hypothetical protein
LKYAIAMLTHYWDDDIHYYFRSLVESVDSEKYDVYLLCDESRGSFEVPSWVNKLGFTKDFLKDLNLLNFPEDRAIWRNADYTMYLFRSLVDADAYLWLENDVLIKSKPLFEEIDHFFENEGDFILSGWNPSQARRVGPRTAKDFYPEDQPLGFLHMWLWGGTRAVIDRLYQERQDHLAYYRPGDETSWPSVEVFLGTFFHNHKEYKSLELRQALKDKVQMHLGFMNTIHTNMDPYIYRHDNIMIHPILKQNEIFQKRWWNSMELNEFGTTKDYSAKTGYGRALLMTHLVNQNAQVYNQLAKGMIRMPGNNAMDWAHYATEHGLTYPGQIQFDNKALLKPVTLSSQASHNTPNESDGYSATDGNIDLEKYRYGGAATRFEDNPWMMIDLEDIQNFTQIDLYHREGMFDRTTDIKVEISNDNEHFEELGTYHGITFEKIKSSRNLQGYQYQYRITYPDTVSARYVKFTLEREHMMFHLNQIEIY